MNDLRIEFVHIRKKAGTSINKMLIDSGLADIVMLGAQVMPLANKATSWDPQDVRQDSKRTHRFAVVRNPWDRSVSG